jgi:integrase
MGRAMKLSPKYDHSRKKRVLNLPPAVSDTGKRKRLFFDTEDQATSRAGTLKSARERYGRLANRIDPDLLKTSIQYNDVAIEYGFSGLRQMCAQTIEKIEKDGKSPKLATLLNAWESDHSGNWSPAYLSKRWKPFKARLSDLTGSSIATMTEDFWRNWLNTWKTADKPAASTYNQQRSMLESLFGHSMAKKTFPINPLESIPARKGDSKEIAVFSPADAQKLMEAAWLHDRDLVPYFAVCLFAGLRPDSEALRVNFQDLDREAKHLLAKVTKTGRGRRFVEASDALLSWLAPWSRMKGSILPPDFPRRRRRLIYGFHTTEGAELNNKATWTPLVPWAHDITRHSYGSYYEAANRSKAGCREKLAANMGHRDYKTYDANYKNARTAAEAKAFWAIRPLEAEDKVRAIA